MASGLPRWPLVDSEDSPPRLPRRPLFASEDLGAPRQPEPRLPRRPLVDSENSPPRGPKEKSDTCCTKCCRPLCGSAITAEGGSYHSECFTCDTCTIPINGKYVTDNAGSLKCERCHERNAPRCDKCGEKVTAKAVTTKEGTFHKECFTCCSCHKCIEGSYRSNKGVGIQCTSCHTARAPCCEACGRKVIDNRVDANGKAYHQDCFSCTMCHKQIPGTYFTVAASKNGGRAGLLCEPCHEIQNPPAFCAECRGRIEGNSVGVGDQTFHKGCFSCCKCRHAIDGSYFHADGGGYLCEGCQPCCAGCNKPLAGSSTIQVDGKDYHSKCFKCCTCGLAIKKGHYEAPWGMHRCGECQAASIQAEEDAKEFQSVKLQRRVIKRNTEEFRLTWRPELEPCSLQALNAMGVPRARLPRGKFVGLHFDKKSGAVSCAALGPQSDPNAAVNMSYLASCLQVLNRHGREPCFSLDAKDPHDLSGESLVKVFYPSWLATTVVGEVLFQADYALKEMCFGEHAEALPWLANVFEEIGKSLKTDESQACRQWFTMRRAVVDVTADGAVVPRVELGVETRRLVKGKNGYEDAAFTDPKDPMVKQANLVTARFNEVAAHLPVVGELLALARAMVAAKFLIQHGCQCDLTVLSSYEAPITPEGNKYSMVIPTLSKEHGTSKVVQDDTKGLVLMRRRRAMHGGVDLSVPTEKVPAKSIPAKVFVPNDRSTPLPLFIRPASANLKFEM